uniref:Uncharacterized protein n=1 Tax=Cannabis sativa TaxID=3483 RepID=A0A803P083_CANSA
MPTIQHSTSSKSNSSSSKFDEQRWVTQISRTLQEELEDDADIAVSVFNVPKILMASDPESYTPQEVAIGPYHYWRTELYEMERYKLSSAKRAQKNLQCGRKFQDLVQHLINQEHKIRACYHKYLDFSGETLAWMMAIDASFLLEFLQVYAIKEGFNKGFSSSSRMSHLVDFTGRKSAHNAILRDIIMLENQIPLFLLRKILEFQFESCDEMLLAMLVGFSKEVSPFKMMEQEAIIKVSECAHLLDFLYDIITPQQIENQDEVIEISDHDDENQDQQKQSFFVTLYLPAVSLDVNAETIMRNLVAYEASNASGPLIFTRYTELMNGIIDTEEDVKFLTLLAAVLMLMFMALQAFCSVYTCARVLNIDTTTTTRN